MEQNKNNDMLLEVKDLRTYFHMPNGAVIKAVEGVNFTLKKPKVFRFALEDEPEKVYELPPLKSLG